MAHRNDAAQKSNCKEEWYERRKKKNNTVKKKKIQYKENMDKKEYKIDNKW